MKEHLDISPLLLGRLPPELAEGQEMDIREMWRRHSERFTLYLVLAGWLVLGTVIIYLSTLIPVYWVIIHEITHDAGIAIYSAVVLGLSVHLWLESRVVRDVFRAAVGHILPPELRDEVNWISSFTCLTQRAVTTLDIEDIGEGLVKLTIEREAELVNFTTTFQKIQPLLAIDDWGIPGKTPELIEFEYVRGNDDPVQFTGWLMHEGPVALNVVMP
jgi:hypothetical protein